MKIISIDCYLSTNTIVHVILNKVEYLVGTYMYRRVANSTPLFTYLPGEYREYSSSIINSIFDRMEFLIWARTPKHHMNFSHYLDANINPYKPKYPIASNLHKFKRITLKDWLNQ